MKKIRTVCGDIAPEELGFTSCHDHVAVAPINFVGLGELVAPEELAKMKDKLEPKWENLAFLKAGAWLLSDEVRNGVTKDDYMPMIIDELKKFKAAGGNSIAEPSAAHGIRGRKIEDFVTMSKESGVNLINATGCYTEDTWPEYLRDKSEDELKAIFEKDIFEGMDGTDIKAGFLKTAFGTLEPDGTLSRKEMSAFRACCRIAKETGMGLEVHLGVPPVGAKECIEMCNVAINEIGLPPEQLMLCHVGQLLVDIKPIPDFIREGTTFHIDLHKKLLDMGVRLSFDGFGCFGAGTSEFFNLARRHEYDEIKAVHELLEAGYAKQLMIGHDLGSCFLTYSKYGEVGFTRIIEFVIPMLKQLGHSDEEINAITVENPKEFFSF